MNDDGLEDNSLHQRKELVERLKELRKQSSIYEKENSEIQKRS